jgi:hypothetical protein
LGLRCQKYQQGSCQPPSFKKVEVFSSIIKAIVMVILKKEKKSLFRAARRKKMPPRFRFQVFGKKSKTENKQSEVALASENR